MSFIEFKSVTKRYDANIAIEHLSLSIEKGEIFGLLGPNGAGKSTAIKMLSGLLPIDQGEILIDSISVKQHPLESKRMIGLVPQELAIYEDLPAKDNISFFGRLYGLRGKLLQERVNEALDFVGLADRAKEKPSTFSGGMKRRLNIACAIMHRPKLIIMDEPTVGIDPQSRNHILESVRKLNELGSTIIYTSHYMEEVEVISTRVGIMDQGRLITIGTKEQLLAQLQQTEKIILQAEEVFPEVIAELKSHPFIESVKIEETRIELDMQSSSAYLQDILFIFAKHHIRIQKFTRIEPNLETLFLSLTGRTLRD